jgi:hypothetical protein
MDGHTLDPWCFNKMMSEDRRGMIASGITSSAIHASSGRLTDLPFRQNRARRATNGFRLKKKSVVQLERRIRRTMLKHDIAANFFRSRQIFFFTLPLAIFSGFASVLALVTATELLTDGNTKVLVSIVAGGLSAAAVFLQTMSQYCKWETRAAMHESVAIDMSTLRESLVHVRDRVELDNELDQLFPTYDNAELMENHSNLEDGTSSDMAELYQDYQEILDQLNHSFTFCKSTIPLEINSAFLGVESNLKLAKTKAVADYVEELSSPHMIDHIRTKAFDFLAQEFTTYFFFPLVLPNSKWVEERTMKRLWKELKQMEKLSSELPSRRQPVHNDNESSDA